MSAIDADRRARTGRAVERVGGRVAFVFGSQVTGRTWAESDLDLAVRWPHSFDRAARARAELALVAALTDELGPLGERTDVVDLDRAASSVAFRAVVEGVCVHQASDTERVRAIVDVARRYDDDAPRRAIYRDAAIRAVARMDQGRS